MIRNNTAELIHCVFFKLIKSIYIARPFWVYSEAVGVNVEKVIKCFSMQIRKIECGLQFTAKLTIGIKNLGTSANTMGPRFFIH